MRKGTWILLLLAVGLGAFVYFYEMKKADKPETKGESKAAFQFKPEEVEVVTLRRGSELLAFEKRDNVWQLTQPLATGADIAAIEALIRAAAEARVSRTIPTPAEGLARYGLDPPIASIELKTKDGHTHRVAIGGADFLGGSNYARINNGLEVVLLPTGLLAEAGKPLEAWRDKDVLRFDPDNVDWMEIENTAGQIRLVRRDGIWKVERPLATRADGGAVNLLLGAIASAKAAAIAAETAAGERKFGLVKPAVKLRIGTREGEKILGIGKGPDGKFFARDASRPQIFEVGLEFAMQVETKLADLREMRVFPDGTSELVKVAIQLGNVAQVYEKDAEAQWKIAEPASEKGKAVQSWKLFEPFDVRAKEVLDSPGANIEARLTKPVVVVELTNKAGKLTTVRFTEAPGGNVYAKSSDGPEVFVVDGEFLKKLDRKPTDMVQ